jgi:predicted ArsR family transcriptional regulator
MMMTEADGAEAIPLLPEDVPVTMPDLPAKLVINSTAQYKALGEPTRVKILAIIQQQPATAKQIADRLGIAPGTAGHHLQTLEAAGLAQVVARRLVRGIVAKYYTRTARIFMFEQPQDSDEYQSTTLHLITHMRDELMDTLAQGSDDDICGAGFPHARLTPARAKEYADRLHALLDEFIAEPPAPDGQVYGMGGIVFRAPRYVQSTPDETTPTGDAS